MLIGFGQFCWCPVLNLESGQERGLSQRRLFHQKRFRDFARCRCDGEHRQAFASAARDGGGNLAVALDFECGSVAWSERNTAQTVAVSIACSRNRHFVAGLALVRADFVDARCHAEAGRSFSSSFGALVFRVGGGHFFRRRLGGD